VVRVSSSAAVLEYDPLSYDSDDPFQTHLVPRVQRESPVFLDERYQLYFVMTYQLVKEVLSDHRRFSSVGFISYPPVPEDIAHLLPNGYPQASTPEGSNLAGIDPPAHAKLRKPANRAFLPSIMRKLEPDLTAITQRLLGEFVDEGRVDIINRFCEPLPIRVVSHLLGIDIEDYDAVRQFTEDSFALALVGHGGEKARSNVGELIEMSQSSIEWTNRINAAIEQRREDPGIDLISQWLQAEDKEGRPALSHSEVVSLTCLSIFAGTDTSVGILAHAVDSMIEFPEEWAEIRADRSLVPLAVEELLRQREPGRGLIRRVTEDTVLGGVEIPAGSSVFAYQHAANRDETVFEDPTRFDIRRSNLKDHLGFGIRTHFCLGAPLIRVEARIAIDQILDRMPNLRYATGETFGYRVTDPVSVRPKGHITVEWDV
jgi:cytochrome P450